MKNYYLILLCLVLFIIVGCGKNEVVCTKTTTSDGKVINEEVVAELDKDNKVVTVHGSYIFNDEELAKIYCDTFKNTLESEYGDKISCTNNKVTIKELEKMLNNVDESKKVVGMLKDDFVKLEGESGHTCK